LPSLRKASSCTIWGRKISQRFLWEVSRKQTYSSHCLNVTRAVLPVNPRDIKAHRGDDPGVRNRAHAKVISDQWRDLAFVCISDCLASAMRLKKRRSTIGGHADRTGGVDHF